MVSRYERAITECEAELCLYVVTSLGVQASLSMSVLGATFMDWSKKVAIVTGGASGIGAATVGEFARENVSVAIFDINQALGQQWAKSLQEEGRDVEFFAV